MSEPSAFVEQYTNEFFQHYRDMRDFLYLTQLRQLEYELYVGIYGEEPPDE